MPLRLLLLLALSAAPLAAQDLSITRVFTGWRDAASFKRISEYFDGKENTGGATVLRTHPAQRGGFYFMVRLAGPGTPRKLQFKLQLVPANSTAQQAVTFAAEGTAGVYQLGLTGPEWQDPKSQPVAWHLQVVAADDISNPLAGVVNYHGQVIGDADVLAAQDDVAIDLRAGRVFARRVNHFQKMQIAIAAVEPLAGGIER